MHQETRVEKHQPQNHNKRLVRAWFWIIIGLATAMAALACQRAAPPPEEPPAPQATVVTPPPSEEAAVEVPSALPQKAPPAESPIPVTNEDPSWGQEDAPVTLVEFSDFQCPFCARVNQTLAELRRHYGPEKLRIVWKNNPLIFHEQARPAQAVAMAVHKLAGHTAFWQFHNKAFSHQKELTEDHLVSWASELGISEPQLRSVDYRAINAKIDADIALAKAVGATGTPAFRINGLVLSGAQPAARFRVLIDDQLEQAQELVKEGTPKADASRVLTRQNFEKPPERFKKTPRPPDTTRWKVAVRPTDPVQGSRDALITLVEFGNFQCPFCKRVQSTLQQLQDKYGKDLRIVWKDNPLPFHKRAKPAANLAHHIAKNRGKAAFWEAKDLLFEHRKNLDDTAFEEITQHFKLNWKYAKAAVERGAYDKRIEQDMDLAMDLNARGTPHFFINGRRLSGAQPIAKFEELIDEQLAIAQELVANGTPRTRVYEKLMADAKGPEIPEWRTPPVVTKSMPSRGSPNAKVVIQTFADFQCPYCQRVNPTLNMLLEKYKGQVRIVFRHFPLPFHRDAFLAAEAAIEVLDQQGEAAFWKFHDHLFANQKALKRQDLEKYAMEFGLDMPQFKSALDNGTHRATVEADMAAAESVRVSGTPSFLVNGYFVPGAQPLGKFERAIRLALKKGHP